MTIVSKYVMIDLDLNTSLSNAEIRNLIEQSLMGTFFHVRNIKVEIKDNTSNLTVVKEKE